MILTIDPIGFLFLLFFLNATMSQTNQKKHLDKINVVSVADAMHIYFLPIHYDAISTEKR